MRTVVINAVRGGLIGVAEVIPGVSGGTVALIVGVYHALIAAGADAVLAVRRLLGLAGERPSGSAFLATGRTLPWVLLIPLGVGMVVAVIGGAGVIEPLLEDYPVQMRALFFGLVLGGVAVPAHMVVTQAGGRWRTQEVLIALLVTAIVFVITGLPPGAITDPSPFVVMGAAAVAVCALVLPGVSGSFFLLTIGLYETTISAVNDRDFAYLGAFALGAVVGLAAFVSFLRWLLEHHARITLVIIVGLMLGSLRALWPWQVEETRELLAPVSDVGITTLIALAGIAVVACLLWVESRLGLTEEQEDDGLLHG